MSVPGPRERDSASREAEEQIEDESDYAGPPSPGDRGGGDTDPEPDSGPPSPGDTEQDDDGGGGSGGGGGGGGSDPSPDPGPPSPGDTAPDGDDGSGPPSPGDTAPEPDPDPEPNSGPPSPGDTESDSNIGSGPPSPADTPTPTEDQEPLQDTIGSGPPSPGDRIPSDPTPTTQQFEGEIESEVGFDVEAGEDFTITQQTLGGATPSTQERTVTVARPTDQLRRRIATQRLETRLEEQTGRDLDPGEDFEVRETDEGFEAAVEEQPQQRPEESFIEGLLSAGDDILEPIATSYEAQSGVDIPGEGAVLTTTETGSPDQITEAARDVTGVEDPTTASEAADETLGQTGEQARQQREQTSEALTGEESPYNVVDNLVEAFDSDREALPFMETYLTEEEISRLEENQPRGSAPGVATAVGPGGAARGATGAARLAGSTGDILRGGAIVGGVTAVGAGAEEVSIPEDESRSELEAGEPAQEQTELQVTDQELGELGIGETVITTEIDVPEPSEADDPTTARTGQTVIQDPEQVDETPTIDESDILPGRGEPEQRGPGVREQQRRDDLTAPEREFPTGGGAVVGDGTAQDPQERVEESQEVGVSQGTETGIGQTPFEGILPVSDVRQDQTVGQRQDQFQAQTQAQETTQTVSAPEYATPTTPSYAEPTAPQYGYPTTPSTGRGRPPRDIELPELPGSDDDEEQPRQFESVAGGIFTDFGDPLTGETIQTETDPSDENPLPGFDF